MWANSDLQKVADLEQERSSEQKPDMEEQRNQNLAQSQSQSQKIFSSQKREKKPVNRKLILTACSGAITIAAIIIGSAMKTSSMTAYDTYLGSTISDEAVFNGIQYEKYIDLASVFFAVGESGIILTGALGLWTLADAVSTRNRSLKVSVAPVITPKNTKVVICAALSF